MLIELPIPKSFDEAITRLHRSLSKKELEYLSFNDPGEQHMFSGMALRNGWDLWKQQPVSPLHDWFKTNLGIGHADDMSSILLESLKRLICGELIDLPGQAKYYQDFWLEQGINPCTQEPLAPTDKNYIDDNLVLTCGRPKKLIFGKLMHNKSLLQKLIDLIRRA